MSDSINENDESIEVNDNFDNRDLSKEDTNYDTTTVGSTSQITTTNLPSQDTNQQDTKAVSDSKFFAIRTTGGQEHVVANILQNKINAKKIGIRSILALDNFKGYIIVEAPDAN
ncbi:MAG TPA: hypothetical protein VJR94_11175, partial [Candidatus Nitrosocosmicus sp.]|nr:hypothetical protein [Candidatus Nitrosocosmicus sp.]